MSDNNDQRAMGAAGDTTPETTATPTSPNVSGPSETAPTTPLPAELAAALNSDSQATTPLGGGFPTPPQPALPRQEAQQPSGFQQQMPQGSQFPANPTAFTSPSAGSAPAHPGAVFGANASNGSALPPGAPMPPQQQQMPHQGAFGEVHAADAPAVKKAPRRAGRTVALIAACGLIAAGAGYGGSWLHSSVAGGQARPVSSNEAGTITVNNPGSVTQTTAIAAEALPSVVTINVSAGTSGGGSGSGVIISDSGYVLTNTHVVTLDGATGAADVSVTTSDGRIFQADVVGTDPTYDLAVIKLKNATNLKPVKWGDSAKLNVGDLTVALGAPLGLSNTVTEGIVSNLTRSISVASSAAPKTGESGSGDTQDPQGGPFTFDVPGGSKSSAASERISIAVIQTDAAINPGNSGGALVNSKGELIGINVAIATAGGSSGGAGSIGVGFSIPSNIAKRIADEIVASGKATHGMLGASVQASSAMKGATVSGAYIASVVDGGAAAKAGLRQGDIVTDLGAARIANATDLTAQVRALAAGSTTTVTYVRDGKSFQADVTLGKL